MLCDPSLKKSSRDLLSDVVSKCGCKPMNLYFSICIAANPLPASDQHKFPIPPSASDAPGRGCLRGVRPVHSSNRLFVFILCFPSQPRPPLISTTSRCFRSSPSFPSFTLSSSSPFALPPFSLSLLSFDSSFHFCFSVFPLLALRIGITFLRCMTGSLLHSRERPSVPRRRSPKKRDSRQISERDLRQMPLAHSSQHHKLVQSSIDHQQLLYRTRPNLSISSTPTDPPLIHRRSSPSSGRSR
jgi:hypothetical protein